MELKLKKARENLNESYISWGLQFKNLSKEDFDLSSHEYSIPYFISIPEKWFKPQLTRILIVGEEGRGNWNEAGWNDLSYEKLADVQKIIDWHDCYIKTQLGETEPTKCSYNKSAFWQRVRKISMLENCVCAWTNLDKIHRNGYDNCPLYGKERNLLHSTDCKILREEINVLEPHIVLFCGYYGRKKAFLEELPTVAKKFYSKGDNVEYEILFEDKIYKVLDGGITYVFSQHPNRKQKEYENKVVQSIKNLLDD